MKGAKEESNGRYEGKKFCRSEKDERWNRLTCVVNQNVSASCFGSWARHMKRLPGIPHWLS